MSRVALSATWTSVTLTKNETWFADPDPFMVHCFNSTVPGDEDGAKVQTGDSVTFASGQTVYYKRASGRGNSFTRVEVGT